MPPENEEPVHALDEQHSSDEEPGRPLSIDEIEEWYEDPANQAMIEGQLTEMKNRFAAMSPELKAIARAADVSDRITKTFKPVNDVTAALAKTALNPLPRLAEPHMLLRSPATEMERSLRSIQEATERERKMRSELHANQKRAADALTESVEIQRQHLSAVANSNQSLLEANSILCDMNVKLSGANLQLEQQLQEQREVSRGQVEQAVIAQDNARASLLLAKIGCVIGALGLIIACLAWLRPTTPTTENVKASVLPRRTGSAGAPTHPAPGSDAPHEITGRRGADAAAHK